MVSYSRGTFFLVALFFVLSGIASLTYQVVWFKKLFYFLGSSTYSQSIVLATFMGGLAIGAFYWGKKVDSARNSLRVFALLEIGIAIYCFFYKEIFSVVELLFYQVTYSLSLGSDDNLTFAFKILASSLSILFPTILMGGTLPVLVKFTSKRIEDVGKNVTLLYFLNSFGAVLGTMLAGFYLIENFGLLISTTIGASIELFIGVSCLFISFYYISSEESININEINKSETVIQTPIKSEVNYKLLVIIAFTSGFSSMLYEVVWLRLLVPILSSTTYSYSVILTSFIAGITIGSVIVFKILKKIKNHIRFIAFSQIAIVSSILITLPFYERIPFYLWSIFGKEATGGADYFYYLLFQFLFCALIIIVPTILIGLSLPIVNTLAVNSVEETGRKVGSIFSINTIGTVLGSLVTGLMLIPLIGISKSLFLGLFINFFLGIYLILKQDGDKQRDLLFGIAPVIVCLSLFIFQGGTSNWSNAIMTSEVARKINRQEAPNTFQEFLTFDKQEEKVLFYKEGITGTIVVAQSKDEVYLYTNGKADANSVGDLATQVSLAQVPMIIHPNPESVFVIGFGAGTTIGNVLAHKNVKRAFVAEISPEVIDASKYFERVNQKPLKDKRLTIIKDDGVSALRTSNQKHDIIISQPSNPWSAGVGNLFTSEFFQDCKEKLNPGGIVAQWFSLYEMNDENLRLILRTVLKEFRNVELWQIGTNDILMLCSEEKLNMDLAKMEIKFREKKKIFDAIDIRSFPVFLSQQFCHDMEVINKYAGKGVTNTENLPLLEYRAPKSYFYNLKPKEFFKIDERNDLNKYSTLLLNRYLGTHTLTNNEIHNIASFHYYYANQNLAIYFAEKSPEVILSWAKFETTDNNVTTAIKLLEWAKSKDKKSHRYSIYKAYILDSLGNTAGAILELDDFLLDNPNNLELYHERGTLHMKLRNNVIAKEDFSKSIELNPNKIEAYNNLATILAQEGKHKEAIEILNNGLTIAPTDQKLLFNRGITYGFIMQYDLCIKDLTKVIEFDPINVQALYLRGKSYFQLKQLNNACTDWQEASRLGMTKANEALNQYCR
jgi:spermidine synthase